jgi:minor tail protein
MAGGVRDFVVNILGNDDSGKAFDSFQATASKAAGAAVAVFAGMELGNVLAQSMQTEALTDKMNAALGTTAADAQRLGEVAADVYGGAWGGSMEEVTGAVESVVSSIQGMRTASDAEIQAATQTALDFAKVFETDVSQATSVAGTLISEGLAKDSVEAFDLMTAGLQQVPEAMRGETLDALSEYSRNFTSLGLSGEQSMALLAASSSSGITAVDKVGDALKELTIRGTDMSKTTGDAYATLGLDSQTMANALLAGGDQAEGALSQIVTGLQGITDPATQANTAIALFGTPLEDLGTAQIPAFINSLAATQTGLAEVDGAAAAMSTTLSDNAATRVEELRRGFEQWKTGLIETDGPLGDIAAGATAFGGEAASMATSVGLGVVALSNLNLGMIATKVAAGAVAITTGVVTAAQWAWNVAMTANPIGLIIVGIGALIAAIVWLVANWDKVAAAGKASWEWIKGAWSGAMPFFAGIGDAIISTFKGAFNAVAGWWNNSIGAIGFTVPDWVPVVGGRAFAVPNIPLLADGGDITRTGLAIVGEAGPELLELPTGARVSPLDNTNPGARGGNGPLVQIGTFNAGGLSVSDVGDELAWRLSQ